MKIWSQLLNVTISIIFIAICLYTCYKEIILFLQIYNAITKKLKCKFWEIGVLNWELFFN